MVLALLGMVSQARVCWDPGKSSHIPCWDSGKSSLPSLWLSQATLVSPHSAGSSGHLCCPLTRGTTRGGIRVTQPRALPQNATFTKKLPTAIPVGWEGASPPTFAQLQALGCVIRAWIWDADPSSPHTEPGTRNRAQPTAQTHKAQSSLPPVTSQRSVGQSWPLPSPQVVSRGPSAAQGHPKPVTHCGPQNSPFTHRPLPNSPLLLPPLPLFPSCPHPIPSCPQTLNT